MFTMLKNLLIDITSKLKSWVISRFCNFWGWVIGKFVMPSQVIFQNNADSSGDPNRLYAREKGSENPDILVFYMTGNGATIAPGQFDEVEMLQRSLSNTTLPSYRLIAFDPPGVNNATTICSQSQIIDGSYNFIMGKMFKYHAANSNKKVILVGWSLGGATMVQVAQRLQNNGHSVQCLADRSFTNITAVLEAKLRLSPDHRGRILFKSVVSTILANTFGEMNAGAAALNMARGSLHTMRLSDPLSDSVIDSEASLSNAVSEEFHHVIPIQPCQGRSGHQIAAHAHVADAIEKMCA